jgi:hypothetical protein
MSKKIDRALHGPSWTEVILGAVLSLLLGVVIGAALLVLKPVVTGKNIPAKESDRDPTAVYYVEGSRDSNKAKQALAKRKAFVAGQPVTVTEDEINSLVTPAAPTPAAAPNAKKGEKAAAPAPAAAEETLAKGPPNVRLHDGVLQVGMPVTLNLLGFSQKLIVQARGGFEKQDNAVVFDPSTIYLGSCPVQRLPFLSGWVRNKVLTPQLMPDDVAAGWAKVSDATIEGNTLKLAMQ